MFYLFIYLKSLILYLFSFPLGRLLLCLDIDVDDDDDGDDGAVCDGVVVNGHNRGVIIEWWRWSWSTFDD